MKAHEQPEPESAAAEAAALDEAYAALAQLLDAAAPPLDEAALVECVARRLERRRTKRRRRLLAVCATLLLAAGGAWWTGQRAAVRAPRAVAVRHVRPELAWDDDFETQVAWTRWAVMSVDDDAHRRPDAAAWVRQRLNKLEWEVGEEDWSLVISH